MSSEPAAVRAPDGVLAGVLRTAARLEREAGPVSLFCVSLALALLMLPHQLLLDGWLTLVSGREVVTNGLPTTDTLTVWTSGVEWVDQQWLAQAVFYALAAVGGIEAVMLGHVALVAVTLGTALVAARRLGAAPRSVALAGTAGVLVAPWAIQMRTQSLAMPLFAVLLWLLAADSRVPSRRVFLVFPLLVLWANLHGTVVLAALFVALRGVTYAASELRLRRRVADWLGRSLVLTVAPFACVFASPYGLDLAGYYGSLFLNPRVRAIAPEWGPSTPSLWTAAFYAVAAATLWLLVRRRSRLTSFEHAALLATMAAGATAIRSLVWFAIAVTVLAPQLLDGRPPRAGGRLLRLGLTSAVAVAVISIGTALAQPGSWYTSSWPSAAAERVGHLADERPGVRIFSDGRYASWLLWTQPQLAGRVSHDVRWELFTDSQFRALVAFDDRTGDWRRTTAGNDVLVLDRRTHARQIAALSEDPGVETAWADERLVVLAQR